MATIDSLDIKISAEVNKANQAINSLVKNLEKLSTSLKFDTDNLEKLGNINGNNFKKLGEGLQSFANAAKSLNGISKTNFNKLASGIERIASIDSSKLEVLGRIDGNSFRGLGEGVKALSSGLQNLQGVKKTDFNRLADGIQKLSTIQPGNMEAVGNALKPLADGINTLSNTNFDNKNLQNLINSLERLANSNVSGIANVDFSTLGNSIKGLADTLSGAKKVEQNTISMTNAIAKLASAGQNANITAEALPNLATKLKDFMQTMSEAPKLETDTIAFAQALAQLANAGKKTEATASGLPTLGENLKKVFDTMSHAPTISQSTIQFTQALAQLASTGGRANNTISSLNSTTGKLSVSMNGLKSSAKNAVAGIKSLSRQILSSMGIYVGIYGIVRGIKSSIMNSMDYIENLNYFNAAFGQVAENAVSQWGESGYSSAEEYYNSFSKRAEELTAKMTGFSVGESGRLESTGMINLGINPTTLMNYQATFAQMSSSMGVTSETALLLSNALTEIGADLASVKNMDFDKVWEDMASGLAGMSRTLDKYGVNIRNVNLQQKLNELGIDANIAALNQNEKALLRTIILLDSTKYAWGDLSKTLDQPANQLRLLKSNFSNLGRSIGNIFLPIFSKVIPYVNAAVIALQRLADWLVKVFGFEGFEWGGIGEASFDMSQLYDNTDNLSDSLSDATDKAKKLKNELMGFDEINKLSDDTESTSSKDTGAGIGNGLLDEALKKSVSEYQKAWDKAFEGVENRSQKFADNIINAFKSGDFKGIGTYISEKLSNALDSINWNLVYQGAKNFGSGLADFLNGLITPDLFGNVGKTIAGFLNTKIYAALSFGQEFNFVNLGESIAAGVNNFFKTFDFGDLANTINTWVKGALKTASTLLKKTDFKKIGKKIGKFLSDLDIKGIAKGIADVIYEGIKGGLTLLANMIKKAPIETTLIAAFAFFKFTKLGRSIATNIFTSVKGSLDSAVKKTGLANSVSGLIEKVAKVGIAGFVEFNAVSGAVEDLATGVGDVGTKIGELAIGVGTAGAVFTSVLGFPAGIVAAAITGLVGAISGINDAMEELKTKELGEAIKDAMTKPGGTPISELMSGFTDSFSEASKGFDTIKEKSSEMDSVQKNIEDTWIEIYKIQEAMENGVLSVEEGKQKLETLFSELATLTERKFSTMNTAIMSAYGEGGSFRAALENLGLDTEAAIDTMITYGYQNSERAKQIAQELVGMDIDSEEYKRLTAELASLTGEMSKFEQATSNFTYDMNSLQGKIDYSEIFLEDGSIDTEALKKYLDEAAIALSKYETSLDDAGKEISQYWQEIYNSATATEEQKSIAKANLDYIPQAIEGMKSDAELQIVGFTDMIQTEFISKTGDIIEGAQKKWNEKSDWDKFWEGLFGAGTKGQYIKEAVDKQQKNVDELSTAIEESFGNLKIKGVGWGSDAAKEIYNSLFNVKENDAIISYDIHTLKGNWKEILTEATDGLGREAKEKGEEAIIGYINAFLDNNNVKNVVNTVNDFVSKAMESWANAQDSHSPSKETEKLGKYAVEGYNLGISNNQNTTIDEINKYINNIMSVFYKNRNTEEAGENIINGIYQGLENAERQLYEKVDKISDNIIGGIKSALKIHSPSRVMFELGGYTMQGFQNGLENFYHPILSSVKNFSNDLQIAPAPSIEKIYTNVKYDYKDSYMSNNDEIGFTKENYRQEYYETNTILKELLSVVRQGRVIELNGRELGKEIQKEDNSYFIRTGRGMFQH